MLKFTKEQMNVMTKGSESHKLTGEWQKEQNVTLSVNHLQ